MRVELITLILTVTIGTLGSGIAGGLLALWLAHRQRNRVPKPPPPDYIDPELDDHIHKVAQSWAVGNGMPHAAPLIESKLRLGANLIEPRPKGWSR